MASFAGTLGLDAFRVLGAVDPSEQLLARVLIEQAADLAERRDQAIANRIANAVAEVFFGKWR